MGKMKQKYSINNNRMLTKRKVENLTKTIKNPKNL